MDSSVASRASGFALLLIPRRRNRIGFMHVRPRCQLANLAVRVRARRVHLTQPQIHAQQVFLNSINIRFSHQTILQALVQVFLVGIEKMIDARLDRGRRAVLLVGKALCAVISNPSAPPSVQMRPSLPHSLIITAFSTGFTIIGMPFHAL